MTRGSAQRAPARGPAGEASPAGVAAPPSPAAAMALAVLARLRALDFAGYDPYDGLAGTSALGRALANASPRGLTQAVKRAPLAARPVLGVRPAADSYTLGHALLGVARLHEAGLLADAPALAADLHARLRAAAVPWGGTSAWAYHFPVHTRFFRYEPSTPNLIVTAFVARGLAAATRAGLVDAADDLRRAAAFILGELPRTVDGRGQCFGYVPGEDAAVHNANLLAALVLCEGAALCGEPGWVDEAHACARFTAACQARDGSWPYSEEPYARWVDGFHTGFVLDGLAAVVRATGDAALAAALERGVSYYVAQLFGPEGEPKYYPERGHPYDALSAAQGLETLHVTLGGPAARAVPGQLSWTGRHLVAADGRVAYQVHRGWTDRREFPRWSAAPMLSALAGVAAAASSASAPEAAP